MSVSPNSYPYNVLETDKDSLRVPLVHDFFANNPRTLPGDDQGPKWVCDSDNKVMVFNFIGIVTPGSGRHHVTPYGTLVDKNTWVCLYPASLPPP
jgi:hypothetical protein